MVKKSFICIFCMCVLFVSFATCNATEGMGTKEELAFCATKKIVFSGSVSADTYEGMMGNVIEPCLEKGKDATLWISSEGGEIYPSFAIYDSVNFLSNAKLTTVAAGQVTSAAVFVYLSGDKRVILPESIILIHDVKTTVGEGYHTITGLQETVNSLRSIRSTMVKILVERTRMTREDAEEFIQNGKIFTAEEAVKYGLAHEILRK